MTKEDKIRRHLMAILKLLGPKPPGKPLAKKRTGETFQRYGNSRRYPGGFVED
jgi:hypothetical protein